MRSLFGDLSIVERTNAALHGSPSIWFHRFGPLLEKNADKEAGAGEDEKRYSIRFPLEVSRVVLVPRELPEGRPWWVMLESKVIAEEWRAMGLEEKYFPDGQLVTIAIDLGQQGFRGDFRRHPQSYHIQSYLPPKK